MDHAYAIEKLTYFLDDLRVHLAHIDAAVADNGVDWPDWPQALAIDLVRARRISEAYTPDTLSELHQYDSNSLGYWQLVRRDITEALGLAKSEDEISAFLRPASPSLTAEAMHSWVWEPAAPLWAAEAHQDAVLTAARTVNRRLQQKLSRHDVGDKELCQQSFAPTSPTPGKPRLRFEGDRTTPTWRARQEGAMHVSAGAFLGIRNLAAHEESVTWTEQEALEYLAAFSVVARWIEECSVETAP
ncbi:TIGR02391 family protein [Streptomyces sp. S584]|uniref:TIGR02391 family protein n=1 Tax=Streptomyces sp. S584 TaxID=3096010 RepID=UPI002AFE789A|nr:TIGR02391 family protein [Streptomyces sp. S584]